jgi:hypothetical protein
VGAGVIPRWYEAQGIETDVVGIDPIAFVRCTIEGYGAGRYFRVYRVGHTESLNMITGG